MIVFSAPEGFDEQEYKAKYKTNREKQGLIE